jgi:hypothetical protein
MNFPNNQNYNNNDSNNHNAYVNINKRFSAASDGNITTDPQNEKTMKFDDVSHSKEGNSVDIKNFIDENELKNTIHKISTANDLGIMGEVYLIESLNNFIYLIFYVKLF